MSGFSFLILWAVCCIGVGVWANNWKRSAFAWFCLAFFLSPVLSAIILLIVGNAEQTKTCPKCAEAVKEEALVCKHCKHEFKALNESATSEEKIEMSKNSKDFFDKIVS